MFIILGGVLCGIIGLVGILNFFNGIMTGILSRRREFAMLQSIGMTGRQLKTMLIYEGLFYALATILFSSVLTALLGPLVGNMMEKMFWFYEYHFTFMAITVTAPVFLVDVYKRQRGISDAYFAGETLAAYNIKRSCGSGSGSFEYNSSYGITCNTCRAKQFECDS